MSAPPSGWELVPLRQLCLPVSKVDPLVAGRSTIRYVDIGSVEGTRHELKEIPLLEAASAPTRARQVLQQGDTVFSTVRPYLEKIAHIGPQLDQEFASTGFCVLRPGLRLDPRWLFHFATSDALLQQVLPHQRGVSYPAVRDKDVLAVHCPLPPLHEQRRIVDIIDDHLSRLEHARRSLGNAEQRAASLSASSASLLISARAGRACTEVRFGGARVAIPAHWRMSTIGDEAALVQYGTGAKTGPARAADDVPVLRMGNVKRGRVQLDDLKYLPREHPDLERLLLDAGDLLFNRTNSAEHVGKSAVFKGATATTSFASYLIRVRLNSDVDPHWANLVINSSFGRAFVSSVVSQQVGQANVNGTKLKAFPLPVPPRAEQERLVAQHNDAVEGGLRLAGFARDNMRRALVLRRSLLDAAFSGRL
jgi:type I restriction enzyme S subunit